MVNWTISVSLPCPGNSTVLVHGFNSESDLESLSQFLSPQHKEYLWRTWQDSGTLSLHLSFSSITLGFSFIVASLILAPPTLRALRKTKPQLSSIQHSFLVADLLCVLCVAPLRFYSHYMNLERVGATCDRLVYRAAGVFLANAFESARCASQLLLLFVTLHRLHGVQKPMLHFAQDQQRLLRIGHRLVLATFASYQLLFILFELLPKWLAASGPDHWRDQLCAGMPGTNRSAGDILWRVEYAQHCTFNTHMTGTLLKFLIHFLPMIIFEVAQVTAVYHLRLALQRRRRRNSMTETKIAKLTSTATLCIILETVMSCIATFFVVFQWIGFHVGLPKLVDSFLDIGGFVTVASQLLFSQAFPIFLSKHCRHALLTHAPLLPCIRRAPEHLQLIIVFSHVAFNSVLIIIITSITVEIVI